MQFSWRSAFGAATAIALALVLGPSAACGDGGQRPRVTDELTESGPPPTFADATAGDSGTKNIPATCANTIKDNLETDVDCGGSQCGKCIDGKRCTNKSDCAGDACFNQKCATPACLNSARDGDETDVDCGGTICARCTLGKACRQGSDCVSGACVNSQCKCPTNMIESSRAGGGGAYCIDQVEVTKGQYDKFITANVPIADQVDQCKPPTNATFVPRGGWPALPTPGSQAFNFSIPVHYVDWCDAYAYCKWSGKELCGRVTGGSTEYERPNDATVSAWYNACSAQGNILYPYGNTFSNTRCNGGQGLLPDAGAQGLATGYGYTERGDLGVRIVANSDGNGNYNTFPYVDCAGGVTNLYQMSGNLAEWEDSCENTGATARCRVRGGSYRAGVENAAGLRCDVSRAEQRVPPPPSGGADPLEDIGFRCCLY